MLRNRNSLKEKSVDWNFDQPEYDFFKKEIWKNIENIEGYLSVYEAFYLYETAKKIKPDSRKIDLPEERAVVEIGAYKGKSTVCIALGLLKNDFKFKLKSIDPLFENKQHCSDFKKLLKKFNIENIVETEPGFSASAYKKWNSDYLISMLWIDGNHEYEYVAEDFDLWSKYLMPNGIIIFHDYYLVGVREVIRRKIIKSKFFYNLTLIDGNLFSAKKSDYPLSFEDKIRKIKFNLTINTRTNSLFFIVIILIAKKIIEIKNFFFIKSKIKRFK